MRTLSLSTTLILSLLSASAPAHAGADTDALTFAVIDAQDHRRADDASLKAALAHPAAELRALAALAVGRIGDASGVAQVAPLLDDMAAGVRANAAFALGLIGGEAALGALRLHAASESDATAAHELYMALGRAGDATDLPALTAALANAAVTVRSGAAAGLGLLFNRDDGSLVVEPATIDALLALTPAATDEALTASFALARYKGRYDEAQPAVAIAAFEHAQNAEARWYLARVLAKVHTDAALTALLAVAASPDLGLRVEVQRALGAFPASERTLAGFRAGLADADAQVVAQALLSVVRLKTAAAPLTEAIAALVANAPSSWIRGSALEALPAIAPDAARALAVQALGTDGPLVPSALRALGTVRGVDALTTLLPYLAATDLKQASAAAEAVSNFDDFTLAAHAKPALLAALARHDLALTATAASIAGRAGWKEFAPALAEAYTAFTHPDDTEGKIAVLDALTAIGDEAQLPLLEQALLDDERLVALAAAGAYQAVTGTDVTGRVPAVSRVRSVTPPLAALREAAARRVVLETTRGTVELQMNGVAPLTVYNFVKLARDGFYDGKTFHRVVPNFVAQGGDPRGDGYGGPGYLIRDEVAPVSHRRGAVGIATAGKDTGGCQFFVDHAPNLHLDGAYTVFADVVRGMDVVDRLEVGDVILKATVE